MKLFKTVFLIGVFWLASAFGSEQKTAEEYSAKAAFIYNFTKFIEWSESPKSNEFTICVLKDSPIIEPLKQIASSKKVSEKKINVVVLKSENDTKDCSILFIPNTIPADKVSQIIKNFEEKNTLIICEKKGSLNRGAAINFILKDDKIKFEINRKSLDKANLKISSQLLKLAVKIQN